MEENGKGLADLPIVFGFGNFPDLILLFPWAMGYLQILPSLALKSWIVRSGRQRYFKNRVYFSSLKTNICLWKIYKVHKSRKKKIRGGILPDCGLVLEILWNGGWPDLFLLMFI